ncbi:MAG: hypothetical protein ABR543_05075 [Gemmatimonadaceae bacterium]
MSFSDGPFDLDVWLAREFRRPIHLDPDGKARLMARVRADASPFKSGQPKLGVARARTFYTAPVVGVALAASLVGVISTRAFRSVASRSTQNAPAAVSRGLGDSVSISVTVLQSALQDTLRLVRFVLVAPTAVRAALVGDFNEWDPRATPLGSLDTTAGRGTWTVTIGLRPGRHRYALVVNDTQWLSDPAAPRERGVDGHQTSQLTIDER